MEKQRLYYSIDGVSPLLYEHDHGNQNTGTSRTSYDMTSFHRVQLVLGLTYSFIVHCHRNVMPHIVKEEYSFGVTRDRNKEYHIFRQTWKASLEPLQCNNVNTFHDVEPSSFPGSLSCSANLSRKENLKLASFNIWNVNKLDSIGETYVSRMERLSKLVNSLDVDIFGFQEVRLEVGTKISKKKGKRKKQSVPTRSQVTYLASQLQGYQFVFQPAMVYMEKILERKEEGLAVFSRYPIISSNYRLLFRNSSDVDDAHQRICLHIETLTPLFGIVHVFVSHLSLSSSSQQRSVVQIWKYMEEFSGIKLLIGDFNAEPQSRTMRFLAGELSLEGVHTQGLFDLWKLQERRTNSGGGNGGFTFSALDEKPVKRIDYIFATSPRSLNVSVITTKVIIDDQICYLPCSDHYMLLTVLA